LIKRGDSGHCYGRDMVSEANRLPAVLPVRPTAAENRLAAMFHHHYAFVWRSVRRLGVMPGAVDDAVQEVFVVASRKLDSIEHGKEKSFLFGTAVRVASDSRRAYKRRRQEPVSEQPDLVDAGPSVDELVAQKRARELLDALIDHLPDDTRPVFVLFELEGLTMAEIASYLDLPPGTVASRLRRAREVFAAHVARLEARSNPHG